MKAIKEEISKVVKLQEELDIDVLVHGEPEVSYLKPEFVVPFSHSAPSNENFILTAEKRYG